MAIEQIRRRHDGVQRVVHVVHDTSRKLTDGGEPTLARMALLYGEELGGALTNHALEPLRFGRRPRVQLVDLSRLRFELSQKREPIGNVALDCHRAAHLAEVVAQRIRAHLDHSRRGGCARDAQHFRAHALSTKRS
jgi:hypothetical protein